MCQYLNQEDRYRSRFNEHDSIVVLHWIDLNCRYRYRYYYHCCYYYHYHYNKIHLLSDMVVNHLY
jgi:hypothetical protein